MTDTCRKSDPRDETLAYKWWRLRVALNQLWIEIVKRWHRNAVDKKLYLTLKRPPRYRRPEKKR